MIFLGSMGDRPKIYGNNSYDGYMVVEEGDPLEIMCTSTTPFKFVFVVSDNVIVSFLLITMIFYHSLYTSGGGKPSTHFACWPP